MLNGVDPLLVIVLKVKPPEDMLGVPLPDAAKKLLDLVGVPIPIYLAEKPLSALGGQALGGTPVGRAIRSSAIIVQSESRSIDMQTEVQATTAKDPLTGLTANPKVTQRGIDTQVTVSLVANRDSVLVMALVAMMEFLLSRLQSQEYSIHYINRSTVAFGCLLNRFSHSINPNSDKMEIELVLSTAKKELTTPIPPKPPIEKVSTISLSGAPVP